MTRAKEDFNPDAEMTGLLTALEDDGSLTEEQGHDLLNQFNNVMENIVDWSICDHENVAAHVSPNFLDRPGETFLSPTQETGNIATFHGKCQDCGAPIPVSLELTPVFPDEDNDD